MRRHPAHEPRRMLWRLFASHLIAAVGSTKPKTVGHVPEQASAFSPE
jgi:hypothetical protein